MRVPFHRCTLVLGLLAVTAVPTSAQEPVVLEPGSWVEGALAAGDRPLPGNDYGMVDRYVLPADFSGPALVTLESDDFDTLLQWGVLRSGVLDILDMNDDAGGLSSSTDSRLRVMVEPGIGEIVVAMYGGGACEDPEDACRYRIRVDVPEPAPPAIRLEYGADVEGVLDPDADLTAGLEGFSPGQRYEFVGSAGDEVWITLESPDFDALLEVGAFSGPQWTDDDGLRGTDSMVWLQLPEDGVYTVVAAPLYGRGSGTYRLRLGLGAETAPRPRGRAGPGGRFGPGVDPSIPLTFVLSRQALVPATDMPPELVMIPHELNWLANDGSRLVNEALGFDLPSPGSDVSRLDGDELVELRSQLSREFFGVETPPTNFGVWALGNPQGGRDTFLLVMAIKSDLPPSAEAVTDFGGLLFQSGDLRLEWMDIQWEESRSALYRMSVDDEGLSAGMRCTAGQNRDPGSLVVCALAMAPEGREAAEGLVAGLRVR